MLWTQAFAAFLIWVGYGVWLRGRAVRIGKAVSGTDRSQRNKRGILAFLASAAVLLGAMVLVTATKQISQQGLTVWGWVLITASGLGFVHLQVYGAMTIIASFQETETVKSRVASDGSGDG